MKKVMYAAVIALAFTACQNSSSKSNGSDHGNTETAVPADPAHAPVISFEKSTYDFGIISQGEKVHYDFKFKNTGKGPLIISNATATCGCTIPEIPKEPVKPGEEGVIKVVFNSEGKMGVQDKVVTITSNANPTTAEVHLTGEIREKRSN